MGCSVSLAFCALPSWVANPPMDDQNYLYGVGEGDSIKQARDDALTMLVSKLNVTVSSSLSRTETQSTLGETIIHNKNVKNETKSEVKKISFNTHEIIANEREEGRNYILVRVDKQKFVTEKTSEIDALEKIMAQKANDAKNRDIVERFSLLKEVVALSQQSATLVDVVGALQSYPTDEHKTVYASYRRELDKTIDEVRAFVASEGSAKIFGDVVRAELVANNIKTSKKYNGTKNELFIDVDTQYAIKFIYSRYMAKVKVIVALKKEDDTLYTTSLECFGNSAIDEQSALNAAAKDFKNKVGQKGILNFLGFDPSIK